MTVSTPTASPSRRHAAVLVAGGSGARFGLAVPKQYLPLAGMSVLRRALLPFVDRPDIDPVVVVVSPRHQDTAGRAVAGLPVRLLPLAGSERQDTVRNALEWLAAQPSVPDGVVVHDAARPLVTAALLDRVLASVGPEQGAIAAVPVRDTLKRGTGDPARIAATVHRSGLWQAQTPQAFPFGPLLAAHRALATTPVTDDAALAEQAGLPVALVEGDARNFKITHTEDLAMAEALLASPATGSIPCTGTGYDVHRLVPGDGMTLCGVPIRAPFRLSGHSDADVGLHALTDAILGAIADGDIGSHFPPSDPQWRGASSDRFLSHALERVGVYEGRLAHIDVTLVCERPKIGPHRQAMRERIAAITGLPLGRVSVKATTSERLGFTGREEGIAALASATVLVPA